MRSKNVLVRAAELAALNEPYALATVVWRRPPSSAKLGDRAVITAAGELFGWVGGGCTEPTVIRESLRALEQGTPRLLCLAPPDELRIHREGVVVTPLACASEGALEVFIEPHVSRPHLVVVGEAPAATALTAMAEVLAFEAVAIDVAEPEELAQALAKAGVGPATFVVVATLDRYDETALEAALATEARYVALVASRRRAAAVLEALRRAGVSEERLERVCAPAGLDLGTIPHPEIAVAILAEIVQLKASHLMQSGVPARQLTREETVDPVCGMTVDANSGRFTLQLGGRTYHFCGDGCRRRFEGEPGKYVTAGG